MRFQALLVVAAVSASTLFGQANRRPLPEDLGLLAITGVSIGADYAGREALCSELRAMSTRSKNVVIVPDGAELQCHGDGSTTFAFLLSETPNSVDQFICEFAAKPSTLVFYQMRAIALKSGAIVTSPEEISEKLQPLGVHSLGSLLAAFDFLDLTLRVGGTSNSLRQIGIHELGLLCAP
jgi:hypothetical protein